uniref:Uncharacterized protein n=1 Tax=Siphoviridae sp. ctE6L85 TaxID=2826202 RepID=A0A8S5QRT8_9CAUD|nr:MAG TPA: hypothetical protein [Siphoviridae sp. ctE6L85]
MLKSLYMQIPTTIFAMTIMFPIRFLPFGKPVKTLQTYPLSSMMNKGQKKSLVSHNQLSGTHMVLLRQTDCCYLAEQMRLLN